MLWVAAAVLLLFGAGQSTAAPAESLYASSAPLAGDSPEQRGEAIRSAFSGVLLKVSGSGEAARNPRLLDQANTLVQQYQRRRASAGSDGEDTSLQLWVEFDEVSVKNALREAGYPVWAGSRPDVLLWLGIESDGERSLLSPDSSPGLATAIHGVSAERGIPVILPLLDLDDRRALTVSDLWGDFEQAIRQASERYDAAVILTGRVRQADSNRWTVSWTLFNRDQATRFESAGASLQKAVEAGMQNMGDQVAAAYMGDAVTSGQAANDLLVSVFGVNSFTDYQRVIGYLQQVDAVRQVNPIMVAGGEVSLAIRLGGSADSLRQRVRLDSVLQPLVSGGGVETGVMDFRLLP